MTKAGLILKAIVSDIDVIHQQSVAASPIDRILQKISTSDLPDKGHFESYMRHKWTINHKPSTLRAVFTL